MGRRPSLVRPKDTALGCCKDQNMRRMATQVTGQETDGNRHDFGDLAGRLRSIVLTKQALQWPWRNVGKEAFLDHFCRAEPVGRRLPALLLGHDRYPAYRCAQLVAGVPQWLAVLKQLPVASCQPAVLSKAPGYVSEGRGFSCADLSVPLPVIPKAPPIPLCGRRSATEGPAFRTFSASVIF